jgi:hypothetical protein
MTSMTRISDFTFRRFLKINGRKVKSQWKI